MEILKTIIIIIPSCLSSRAFGVSGDEDFSATDFTDAGQKPRSQNPQPSFNLHFPELNNRESILLRLGFVVCKSALAGTEEKVANHRGERKPLSIRNVILTESYVLERLNLKNIGFCEAPGSEMSKSNMGCRGQAKGSSSFSHLRICRS